MNLVPEAERNIYRAAIDDMHATFSRDITVWRRSAVTISPDDENFDAFSDRIPTNRQYVSESRVFKARIKYIDKQDKEFDLIAGSFKTDIVQEFQLLRIKVNNEANNYIKDCEKITVDNYDYMILTVPRPHGLFDIDYFTIYLRGLP